MLRRRTAVGITTAGLIASGALLGTQGAAQADFAPQPNDVVTTGSDIIQTSFNFLADGYQQLPGYNTAGNRWRFVNFDSSGDAQGRSAYTDPSLLPTVDQGGTKYVKQSDVKLLNPTISLRAGQPLVVRPSGGGGGGLTAVVNDEVVDGVGGWIDVGRSPNLPSATDQNTADSKLGSRLYSVKIGTDRQLIATSTTTNAPATLSGDVIEKIYSGTITQWGQVPGYTGPAPTETIIPLTLPSDAGMWTTFVNGVKAQTSNNSFTGTGNSSKIQVQQNDPTAISSLPEAQRKNAIVPFPRGRFKVVANGYYTVAEDGAGNTNPYNGTRTYTGTTGGKGNKRKPADVAGIKLLDPAATAGTAGNASAPYGTNFAYTGILRKSDVESDTPWQPGSTLNWAEALFYNPDGPAPFVNTEAGRALIEAAGITPDYQVYDQNNNPLID